nr:hypothetical protein [Tanacetum cinerariifolium]
HRSRNRRPRSRHQCAAAYADAGHSGVGDGCGHARRPDDLGPAPGSDPVRRAA